MLAWSRGASRLEVRGATAFALEKGVLRPETGNRGPRSLGQSKTNRPKVDQNYAPRPFLSTGSRRRFSGTNVRVCCANCCTAAMTTWRDRARRGDPGCTHRLGCWHWSRARKNSAARLHGAATFPRNTTTEAAGNSKTVSLVAVIFPCKIGPSGSAFPFVYAVTVRPAG